MPPLLAVPNISEGRDQDVIGAIAKAFGPGLIYHSSDWDHHRAVYTLTGAPGQLHQAVLNGARTAIELIDLSTHAGLHPRVGVLDVAPIVYLEDDQRGAACAEALVLAEELGRLGLPVYLYGELGGGRTRAELRRPGGLDGLDPTSAPRATRPPAPRSSPRGPRWSPSTSSSTPIWRPRRRSRATCARRSTSVRWGLRLTDGVQVSTNIEDHTRVTPAEVVAAVREHATVTGAELVAPAPRAALADFPEDVRSAARTA